MGFSLANHRRNCAFYTPGHKALLGFDKEPVRLVTSTGPSAPGINILPAILLPLAGPEEFDLDVSSNNDLQKASTSNHRFTTLSGHGDDASRVTITS